MPVLIHGFGVFSTEDQLIGFLGGGGVSGAGGVGSLSDLDRAAVGDTRLLTVSTTVVFSTLGHCGRGRGLHDATAERTHGASAVRKSVRRVTNDIRDRITSVTRAYGSC